ncbi:MAG: asparaginase [Proteobacteria bacterium]|nr:asparaginase [Pseudomonadota bacterium]
MVELTRGGAVESRHRGRACVVEASGRLLARWGDIEAPVFPRSAVKPLQAVPMVESGAAAAFALTDAEVALACGSHTGSAAHVAAARAWLGRVGLAESDLSCGAHAPRDEAEAARLARAGEAPSALHNNCSGKHAGFLTLALHMGWPTAGYAALAHPVQQRVLGTIEAIAGADLGEAPKGIDGCGVPTVALPLANLALALARLAAPDDLAEARAAACRRIAAAMAGAPEMVAGAGRFPTEAIKATRGRVLVKSGAEGVYVALLPGFAAGVALKIEDGAGRAAEVAMAALLAHLGALDAGAAARLRPFLAPVEVNWSGVPTGELRPAPGWPA